MDTDTTKTSPQFEKSARDRDPVPGQILHSVPQGARVLGLSDRSIWEFIKRGEIRVRRIGTRVLIHRRELERFANRDHEGVQK